MLDFGARFDGYCSDMTRTVWVGRVADADLRRAVDVVLASQAAGVAAVGPGVKCAEVDQVCREVIAARRLGGSLRARHRPRRRARHPRGPVGGATSVDTLEVGHVVTVEPGVYLPGLGGVRIEDTVVVTDDGCRPLTSTPKDLP